MIRPFKRNQRHIVPIRSFAVQEKGFYHHQHSWRQGTIASIDPPTIIIKFYQNIYTTHESRVGPSFSESSHPPPLNGDQTDRDHTDASSDTTVARYAPLSDVHSLFFVTSRFPVASFFAFETAGRTIAVSLAQLDTSHIDSDSTFVTVNKALQEHKCLFNEHPQCLCNS